MTATRIGYARCSLDTQDLAAQRAAFLDHGMTGTTRVQLGLDKAGVAVRAGDALVDCLARSVPDVLAIGDYLVAHSIAELFEVSRATVYRVLERTGAGAR